MKKKKINENKLAFSKETVALLNVSKLNGIIGGNVTGKLLKGNSFMAGYIPNDRTGETSHNGQ